MAAKKQAKVAPSYTATTEALVHGANAAGAKFVRRGFAFTEADDLAFALGFPHYLQLVENHPDDQTPAEVAKKTIIDVAGLTNRLSYPRQVATRIARGLASTAVHPARWTAASDEVVGRADPIGPGEARELLLSQFSHPGVPLIPGTLAMILEAMHGPDLVAEAITDGFEAHESSPRLIAVLAHYLGIFLLRVRADRAPALRERLVRLRSKWAAAEKLPEPLPERKVTDDPESSLRALDITIDGAKGAARSLLRVPEGIDLFGLFNAVDDPNFVATIVAQHVKPPKAMRYVPDARLAFLGGPSVIDHARSRIDSIKLASDAASVVETFGRIADPRVVKLMEAMASTSKAKKEAQAWLDAHAK
jgi:hypothetical protein